MKFKVSYFNSRKDNVPRYAELSFDELRQQLTTHVTQSDKDGPSWSPTVFEGTRAKSNARELCCLVYDIDYPNPELGEELQHYSYVMHTTHSGNWRLIIPLASPISAKLHDRAWSHARKQFELNQADLACKDASRLFYLPSHPEGATPRTFENQGRLYDANTAPSPTLEAIPVHAQGVDTEGFNKPTGRDQAKADARAILEGTFAPPSGERYERLRAAAMSIVSCNPNMTELQAEALAERAASTIPLDNEKTYAHWRGAALTLFNGAIQKVTHEKDLLNATLRATASHIPEGVEPITVFDDDGKGKLKATDRNLMNFLKNSPEFDGLSWNAFANRVSFKGTPLDGCNMDSYPQRLIAWVNEKFKVSYQIRELRAPLMAVAREREFNPLKDYLKGLKWDGKTRIDYALHNYCKIAPNPRDNLYRALSRKFFIGAVMRGMRPGCKVDTVLVLQGLQGTSKTRFVETLGGPWYQLLDGDVSVKDNVMKLGGAWFIELAELSSLRKSHLEQVKAFITNRFDRYRIPYASEVEDFPRHCVFVGTTNASTPFSDTTGTRRFWPVTVGHIAIDLLEKDRDQLFAEAMQAMADGEAHFLSCDQSEELAEEAAVYTTMSVLDEDIQSVKQYFRNKASEKPTKTTVREFLKLSTDFNIYPGNPQYLSLSQRIAQAFRALKFRPMRTGGSSYWVIPDFFWSNLEQFE